MADDIFTIHKPFKDKNLDKSYISGFYYDDEMANPLTRITLHANKKHNKQKVDANNPYPWEDPSDSDKDDDGYSLTPIASAVLSEDFSLDIANNYTDFGGDPIANFWNEQKAMAPYLGLIADAAGTISEDSEFWNQKNHNGASKWATEVKNVAKWLKESASKRSEYLSRSIHVKGTQFSYYGGTGISFNNLSMKYTILSDWDNGEFKTVSDKLTGGDYPLLNYVIGDYIPVTEVDQFGDGAKQKISEFASWQLPPGGFKANLENVDGRNDGSLKLRIGPYYSLTNLVITGCSLSFSKTMIKHPNPKKGSPYLVPMSCDVALQFRPSSKYSKNTLKKVILGETNVPEIVGKINPQLSEYFN